MRDEDFEIFIEEMGEATASFAADSLTIKKYEEILPKALTKIWREEGWNSYAEGLFWVVNPDDFLGVADQWIEGTAIEKTDKYHIIARSAFGDLYAWGERYNRKITISPLANSIVALMPDVDTPNDNPELAVQSFFALSEPEIYDIEDSEGNWLFSAAKEKFGVLGIDEMYCFKQALVLGGEMSIDNIEKVNMHVHLSILRQLAEPKIPFAGAQIRV